MRGVTQRSAEVGQFTIDHIRNQNSGIDPTPVEVEPGEAKTEVIRRFLRANPDILTEMGRVGAVTEAFGQKGDEWAEAWRTVEPQVDHDLENTGTQETPNGVTCPCCGETFDYLPAHLPTCAA